MLLDKKQNSTEKVSKYGVVEENTTRKVASNFKLEFDCKKEHWMCSDTSKPMESSLNKSEASNTPLVISAEFAAIKMPKAGQASPSKKKTTLNSTSSVKSNHRGPQNLPFNSVTTKMNHHLTDNDSSKSSTSFKKISIPCVNSVRDRMKKFESKTVMIDLYWKIVSRSVFEMVLMKCGMMSKSTRKEGMIYNHFTAKSTKCVDAVELAADQISRK
ncbi:hypothetical protein DICVIV_10880 [Dictyocaulus viviparus]|uniref:Uncharacterized protein n=1 Tax=Dictyocaulus viviparus TaxID=29172 RepID=A0A0D8XH99_DICVI|nr:hypothetical protein DICVIV_10880 [Dictyocaulus viviparus]